ncbi:hypothetical protein BDW60DRAFT_188193 [Aspergillus nidulans var. acristatus]
MHLATALARRTVAREFSAATFASSAASHLRRISRSSRSYPCETAAICSSVSLRILPAAAVWSPVCVSRGRADLVVSVWICVSISWRSNNTRESGVDRSSGVSVALLVATTSELANAAGEKAGSRKAS